MTLRQFDLSWTDQWNGPIDDRQVYALATPVRVGTDPYGLMMRYQGIQGLRRTASEVAHAVFEVLVSHKQTRGQMAETLVAFFEVSHSWSTAKVRCGLLEKASAWRPELLRRLESSCENNAEIKDAFGVPGRIRTLVRQHSE